LIDKHFATVFLQTTFFLRNCRAIYPHLFRIVTCTSKLITVLIFLPRIIQCFRILYIEAVVFFAPRIYRSCYRPYV